MHINSVAEIIQSDIKVNIFLEDEKKKHYDDRNKPKEDGTKEIALTSKDVQSGEIQSKHVKSKEEESTEVQVKENRSKEGKFEIDVEKGIIGKDGGNKTKGDMRRQQTTWVQFNTGYGGGGYGGHGGGGGYQGHGAPLHYDPTSRNYFVKFVFTIVLIMLCITAAFTAFVLATPDVKETFRENNVLFIILAMCIVIPLNYVMFCSECARRPPCNFLCLLFAVVGMSLLVSAVTCRYRTNIVFYAVITTLVVVAVCVLLACTSFDFTSWYLYVVAIVVAFAVISTIISVTMLVMNIHYKPLHIGLLFVGTILNIIVLIMELQMILGGGRIEIGENDYSLAAYMLYTSIVDIFLKIVQIMGMMDE
ncbi:uncharacterized protein LOC119836593 [Zerene cesonia]|uniref:uncharacterized protein LOC119836593 n=1 Tax=Zerene cesonia TaxID=33412 RepID=UPI0018E5191C|nr:uncharacterized protein LOC119836593 [Zerene cesonia]